MLHWISLKRASTAVLLLLHALTYASTAQADDRPNFILIFADDLGFGDLKSFGHPYSKTDNIDRLAQEGTRFHQFHVTGSVCPTSRSGLMTSRNPSWFPNFTEDYGFMGTQTVTKMLQEAGYLTGHIGKWHIGPTPTGTQYDDYGIDDLRIVFNVNDPAGRDLLKFYDAIDFVEEHENDTPFYLNLWVTTPHAPFSPKEELMEPFKDITVDRELFGSYMQDRFDKMESLGGNITIAMQTYLGEVYGLDLQVGRLLDKLDELNLSNNTVVVFTSDNGPATHDDSPFNVGWAGGLRGTKHTYYQGGIVVPFIIRWPGRIPAGKVNDQSFFSALEWLPTVGSLAGADIPWNLIEGEDVSDVWLGSNRSRTNPIFYRSLERLAFATMRSGKWKILDWVKELYDLELDPEEGNNVYDAHPDVVAEMLESIRLWEDTLPIDNARLPREALPFDPTVPAQVIGPPIGLFL